MGLETGTYISDLNQANPDGATDLKSEGDNHLRLIKKTILNTFPNIAGEVTPSQDEINPLVGVTARTGGGTVLDSLASGTLVLFQQTTAPTGWTKQVTHNDKALRIVSGAASSGGTDAFSTTFSAAKATEDYTLLVADIPDHAHSGTTNSGGVHTHTYPNSTGSAGAVDGALMINEATSGTTASSQHTGHVHTFTTDTDGGGNGGHAHDITMDVQYVDVIIASKD